MLSLMYFDYFTLINLPSGNPERRVAAEAGTSKVF
jgi:hypothetical protein